MTFHSDRLRWAAGRALGFALLVPALLVSACGGGGGAAADTTAPPVATQSCADLARATVAASAIGLPTTGAIVSGSVPVAASSGAAANAAGATVAYCLVSGDIKPVDTSAPNIKFQLALPENWNGKAVMYGGGGWNGTIPSTTSTATLTGATKVLLPLGRGYAVFASDSGHQATADAPPGAFVLNAEAYRNYIGDALKKTRDVAVTLIKSRYGRVPERSYFLGFSKGGGEAITVSQRWPADWDGIVAGAPGWNFTTVGLQMVNASQAFAAPGAWLNEAKRGLLYRAAVEACDNLDGASDGIISNVQQCAARFNPASASVAGVPLRCAGGLDTGDNCLSSAQLAALKRVNDPTPLAFALASGETSLPGYPVYLADNGGGAGTAAQKARVAFAGQIGSAVAAYPVTASMAGAWQLGEGFARYVAMGDASFVGGLAMDLPSGAGVAPHLVSLSALDANITDLTPFMARGGKLLIWTGTADGLISPRSTEFLYARLQSAMGAAKTDGFIRFYEIPAAGHGTSAVFQPEWDPVSALENWVEKSQDPANTLVVTDDAGVPGRTRPMCTFPLWPRYKGAGDVNNAASFSCAAS